MTAEKRNKDEISKGIAKTIATTTHTHGKWGKWGETVKEPGTFEVEALEPELEIVAVIEEVPVEVAVEPESVEETEAVVEAPKEAVEAEPEAEVEVEEEPAIIEAEAEPEPIVEEEPKVDNTAEIEALKAKLAELTK